MEAVQTSTALLTRRERREAAERAIQVADAQRGLPHPSGPLPIVPGPDAMLSQPASRRERREAALRATGEFPRAALAPSDTDEDLYPNQWDTSVRILPVAATERGATFEAPRTRAPHRSTVRRSASPVPQRPVAPVSEPVFTLPGRPVKPAPRPVQAPVTGGRSVVPASIPVPAVAAPLAVDGPRCDEHAADAPTVLEQHVVHAHGPVTPAAALHEAPWSTDVTMRWQQPFTAAPPHAELDTATEPRQPSAGRKRWAPRIAVLTSLAVATIAVPITGAAHNLDDSDGGVSGGPSLLDAVSGASTQADAPASVRALAQTEHAVTQASRSEDRTATGLADCDSTAWVTGGNGVLDEGKLCELWQKGYYLQPQAAQALEALNEAYQARFGEQICLVAAYRPLSEQYTLATTRAGFAATPGTSDHGLGIAIDFCSSITGDATKYNWIRANSGIYGWHNPYWALPGGVGSYEPWHFEYFPGIKPMGGSV